jgi:GTP cyclohydrolase I
MNRGRIHFVDAREISIPHPGEKNSFPEPVSSKVGQRAKLNGPFISEWDTIMMDEVDTKKLERAGRLILEALGEDPNRDGLKDTPKRFAKYYSQIMNGNFLDPKDYVTEFDNDGGYDGAVVVKDLPFYALCEHHLAPFIGTWDVAYKPGEHIIGLSKLVRIARVFQKRPQVQERLTKQISDTLDEILQPEWVVVRMKAEHFCMSTRGVRTPGALTETLSGHGNYSKDIFNQ